MDAQKQIDTCDEPFDKEALKKELFITEFIADFKERNK